MSEATHRRHFHFAMGHEPDELFIHGTVPARSHAKAVKKVRRILINTGWSHFAVDREGQEHFGRLVDRRREKRERRKARRNRATA